MGSLDVKLELSDGTAWLIFIEKGDKGKDWKKGQGNIDIPAGLKYRVRGAIAIYITFESILIQEDPALKGSLTSSGSL